MILGIGVDLVCTRRIQALIAKYGNKFTNRIFSEKEILDSLKYRDEYARARHFAKRFAAKEAYVKALGLGFGRGVEAKDISVHNDPYGQPMISLEGGALRNGHVKLSMSDDGDYAIAFVTLHT
ncbi:holo-[acyl-carrier-protein] synthase [Anaplasma phagocytophilum]|uniref:Holo-[acyl-carrier-protein] synthase n=3 Tax=Anaplasma phagocytophilum TaxID=948 RepID=ACPS_ANAPZ|nr:holo-[acyl-carrier-protein] synthase [Anaplasma phagocytophilum]Q2GK71.1 RecName: Full=Holo-[acyl-carrier-protein] synthase; Short=Holo-ACP synthase; AltName: Full=4'-phosphopantetheinyl transferase AcpS [Anaplasma phagocytophilum str. HZ]KJZ99124.1 holo-[acyl-carrier-protein] synthase [Anaplasma phagocytophilum str. CR1007]ABD43476.1 holo-(acyl-carrier-protein) synthase [Anaplasma phagocytophilum str. HZ]AGR78871.1 4'-phosphopantetheinyl transferase [Anaplasma phagocytophilum str. HZ2]AGR8